MKRVLVVDDNPDILDALDLLLSLHNYKVSIASTIKDAVFAANNQCIDLIIQDMNFSQGTTSGEEGRSLFYQLKEISPATPIIIITAWSQLEIAVELVKAGAADYLPKPWDDMKLLDIIAENIVVSANIVDSANNSNEKSPQRTNNASQIKSSSNFIVESQPMKQLVAMADKVANSDISVLITGANGSGKERIADYIHQNSPRNANPFIKVNMGALASELMEAELFGAEKGAYTGATAMRKGRFEAANGGTLFLDEIGNLSLAGQMKLLRVLQTGQFERVGSSETITVDVRVISATNSHLPQAIEENTFREDLYYRLNVVELNLPPLAQRQDDIIPLARHFISGSHQLSEQAASLLKQQPWPGNVRELENHCQRAMVLCADEILLPEHFMLGVNSSNVESSLALNKVESAAQKASSDKDNLKAVLNKHEWIISRAANELGLSRQALYRRIEKYQLSQEEQ
ncbi:sigma-54 dependent transcriptional regulator [Colwellia sp. 4_MG-2023]|uniref:sigma-54-dependent transcriptional regulator n=1 Tax=unclassified Colwellia TaxID=196834 RepID=UPI0026E27D0B|nr:MULTISPECIES: sigma-54 dependent transcriptional regulator [unclassified Colwellia]MDO6505564.1 sigma-54 dependent transcriptional regulator [Colwellia sp. 5_MG-2023]MDO6554140.1 sigma-54 dependent transcriptional regulator [Colwellia sp. 4_MG-2023]